ncbi:MAG: acyl-CoA desaturase [Nitrospira sp.]|nr:acyl-CoA desaturase [Nitrospira sp.]
MNNRCTVLNLGIPMVGSIYAVLHFTERGIGWIEVSCLILFFTVIGLGITLGFHRYFTHQGFHAITPLGLFLAAVGSMAFQGPVIGWVADHRRHHRYTDQDGDPHSPHVPWRGGWFGRLAGLLHAHVGWIFTEPGSSYSVYAQDLLKDPTLVLIERTYLFWAGLSLGLPWLYGYVLGGPEHGLDCLLFGGCVRAALMQHCTWSVNSFGHAYGYQTYKTGEQSRNNFVVAMLTLGEGWHNNHHAFPRCAFHGLKSHEYDVTGLIVRGLERLGLVSDVIHPTQALLDRGRR